MKILAANRILLHIICHKYQMKSHYTNTTPPIHHIWPHILTCTTLQSIPSLNISSDATPNSQQHRMNDSINCPFSRTPLNHGHTSLSTSLFDLIFAFGPSFLLSIFDWSHLLVERNQTNVIIIAAQ
eukprot:169786_1